MKPPPRRALWLTCEFCTKRGWVARKEAKVALRAYYPHEFQTMHVYRCKQGGYLFHHGHRIPTRFRDSLVSACVNCHRQVHRESAETLEWTHVDDGRVECGLRDLDRGILVALPGWMAIWG